MRKDGLTEKEGIVMDSLVDAWNAFVELEKQHPSEKDEFADGIHKCQLILGMRALRRYCPKGYPIK